MPSTHPLGRRSSQTSPATTGSGAEQISLSDPNVQSSTCEVLALDAAAALALANVEREIGLSAAEVRARLARLGHNRLAETPPRSPWRVFIGQFSSVLILVLLGAALLSALIGNLKDAVVIAVVVLLNATLGFFQEYRAERSLAALREMLPAKTRVRRDGHKQDVAVDGIVPGDIVLLEAGDRVPADGRLVLAAGVEADESTLTGESQPVAKHSGPVRDATTLGDRANMLFMNTLVTRGRAELLVSATGPNTETGRLSHALAATAEPATPLQRQLDALGKRLGAIALTLVGLLAFLEFLRGSDITHIVLDAVALAVAAIPEGLPVVVTVTLALGMHQLARRRAIVKRLASVETLGCTTVICSDKTGTLTLNQMTARAFFVAGRRHDVSGEGYRITGTIRADCEAADPEAMGVFLDAIVGCNDSRVADGTAVGDPTEAALLVLAEKARVRAPEVSVRLPRIAELSFESSRKYMATFHRDGAHVQLFVKGAPDVLLPLCGYWLDAGGARVARGADRELAESNYLELAERGMRGLLVATRTLAGATFDPDGPLESLVADLTFVGIVGLLDPPREQAKEAITRCRRAGIAVKMITGDHKVTGLAIARELGLHGSAMTGAELDALGDAELAASVECTVVFARVSPSHKVRIVQALRARGHVVAMTGDGVNDAPALKTADIGVAMGVAGTDVAKEAAMMVLADDDFSTIVRAVHAGRILYDNILKFVRFQLSTTCGAILTVFFAPLAGLPEPFTALQILWVAIIMDGPPAVSLALDAGRPGLMSEAPRRRDEPVLSAVRLVRIAMCGVTMMAGTLGLLHYGMQTGTPAHAATLAFTTFVLFQVFNVFNARNETGSCFNANLFKNPTLWASLAGVLLLQVLVVHWRPATEIFGTVSLSIQDWMLAISVASLVLILEEARKALARALSRLAALRSGGATERLDHD